MNLLLVAFVALLLVPVAILCAECLAAMLPSRRNRRGNAATTTAPRPPIAVLIPAHNEESVLSNTLSSLMPQMQPHDRIVVIADNCDDSTVAVAHGFGAIVVERTDVFRRGKGYALDHGMRFLDQNPPAIVIMFDADCTIHPGAVDALASQVGATGRPAQALYLLDQPRSSGSRDLVSALAFLVKNQVRPRGLYRLGLPCLLTGTGMAFPWSAIAKAKLASGNIVEDMQLGLDLALESRAPLFCDAARVTGHLPVLPKIAYGQRTRWEHGHLQTLLIQVPRIFKAAFSHWRPQAIALALEIAVPPLCLLMMVMISALGALVAAAMLGAAWLPAQMIAAGIAAVAICLFGAWFRFGRKTLPLTALLAAPFYMAWKVPMYFAFIFQRHTEWNRTSRAGHVAPAVPAAIAAQSPLIADKLNIDFPAPAARPHAHSPRRIELGGVDMDAVTSAQCVDHILRQLDAGHGGMVVRPTLEHLRQCARDPAFATLIESADLIVADGLPLLWASRLQGTPLPAHVDAARLCWDLIFAATRRGRSIFLLGDDRRITSAAAAAASHRCPAIKLVGSYDAPNGFDSHHEAFQHLAAALSRATPDIALVALGTPKQERLIDDLRRKMTSTWWLAVGSNFEFLLHGVQQAPRRARRSDAHGVHRDPQAPGRPYLIDNLPVAASLLGGAAMKRLARVLSKSAPHERALRQALESGIEHLTVADEAPAIAETFSEPAKPDPENRKASTPRGPEIATRRGPLARLRTLVLLGGSVRPTRLTLAIRRSLLDLPLEDSRSILCHWHDYAVELCRAIGLDQLLVRVLVDQISHRPTAPADAVQSRAKGVRLEIERDASRYRGTAGVLHDLSHAYADDDYILVANAAQAMLRPLTDLAGELAAPAADISLVTHHDGTPSGLMLVRCAALRSIAATGYIDMKEQALPALARQFNVQHLPYPSPTGLPVRTLAEYISALQHRYRWRLGQPITAKPFAEDCRPSFAIVEAGAVVPASARIYDSVILRGAHVGENALVVRSLVCPETHLAPGERAIDKLVTESSLTRRPDGPAAVTPEPGSPQFAFR